jgi:hypothetical protein
VLEAPTVESLEVQVYATSTPVGTAPGFALTAEGTRATTSTTFTSGAWATAYGTVYDAQRNSISDPCWTVAQSPTIGVTGSLTVASGDRKWVWVKVVAGSETAVLLCGTLIVP